MTQEDVIKCGCWLTDTGELVTDDIDLEAFAKLVAEHEREACAKVCEFNARMNISSTGIADAIRAREKA